MRARVGGAAARRRMTGPERREQILRVARGLFAEKGYDAASIEEIAVRAGITKPVVYEHFSGKEELYAVVVAAEMERLRAAIVEALASRGQRDMLVRAAQALLGYIEDEPDGFRILVRDSPLTNTTGYAGLVGEVASRVETILASAFEARGPDAGLAPLYARALVGMIASVGEWWLDTSRPPRDEVAAHLVNLAWNGLRNLQPAPQLQRRR